MPLKSPKFGVYHNKDRSLQEKISFEHVTKSWRVAAYWKYKCPVESGNIDDISNVVFMENPDRIYESTPILLNIDYASSDESVANLNQFNIINPFENQKTMRIHTYTVSDDIGRNPVIGDVIQIYLYNNDLKTWIEDITAAPPTFLRENEKEAWLEITDVDYSQEVENFYLVLTTQRLEHSRKAKDIPNDSESNQNILDNIQSQLSAEQNEAVSKEGINNDEIIEVENPFEDESETRPDYSVKPKPRHGFFNQAEE